MSDMDIIFKVLFTSTVIGCVKSALKPIIHTNHNYLNVAENIPRGTEIFEIDASSQTNDNVAIRLYDNVTAERVELIPVRTGNYSLYKVRSKEIPDREVEPIWFLTFVASDRNGDTVWTLPLHIDDVNDHAPIFEHDTYHSVIGYGLSPGSKILHVSAIDLDTGPNAAITYSIGPHNLHFHDPRYDVFSIDADTGDITLKDHLLHTPNQFVYHLQVNATDGGIPKHTSSTLVEITVLDFGFG